MSMPEQKIEPNHSITFRKELYTEVIQDDEVVALYKQNGAIRFFKAVPLTAAGLDKIVGADKPQSV